MSVLVLREKKKKKEKKRRELESKRKCKTQSRHGIRLTKGRERVQACIKK